MKAIEISDTEFGLLRDHLLRVSGIDVPSEKRYLFKTRLGTFLRGEKCSNFSDFYVRLQADKTGELEKQLVQAMTTHESSFFRDTHPYDLLRNILLPRIGMLKAREKRAHSRRIRILSAGCSKGQEPYSIAICVLEWLKTQSAFGTDDVVVMAVDISQKIIDAAQHASYGDLELGGHLSEAVKRQYLERQGKAWTVGREVSRMVRFAVLNLSEPFGHIGKFDIIFCRNVIIYFALELKRSIIHQFRERLEPSGVLVMGASESLYNVSEEFSAIHEVGSTYYVPGSAGEGRE